MMSTQHLAAAPAGTARTAAPIPSAAQLAARIQIPRRLPPRYDGQPLEHLSHSSYNRFVLCPEDWRRRYLLGEKTAPSGSMFLGRQVDDAITLYYRHILEHGERLSADQLKDAFWDGWKAAAEAERAQLGIAWEADLREDRAFKLGLDAVALTFSELIPHLGEPVAVQRKVEYTIAPGLEWSVLCYLDLETRRPEGGASLPAVVDYKVKTTPLTQYKADHDFQPAVLPRRALAGRRSRRAVLLRPDRQARPAPQGDRRLARDHKQIDADSCAARSPASRRSRDRSSPATSGSAPMSRGVSPTPSGWKCSERYCEAWGRCPGGAGL